MTNSHVTLPRDPAALAPDWRRCAVFLDFDGTLAPLEARPEQVRLPDRERALIERLCVACDGAVAIVTGRDLADIAGFFDGLPVVLSGSHGVEIALPDDDAPAVGADVQAALDRARDTLAATAQAHDLLLERKAAAVALHYRSDPAQMDQVQRAVDAAARADADAGLKSLHGNMVSEVTLRGIDKGTALRRMMQHPMFAGRCPVAAGDDTTDEDAIRAARDLGGHGLRIGGADSAADLRFKTRADFIDWLEQSMEGL